MRTVRIRSRVACFVGAMALLFVFAPVMAGSRDYYNRPVDVTFTKWGVTAPPLPAPQPPFGLLAGFAGDGPVGSYVGEVLWRQASLNGHVVGLTAMYEVVDGDCSFTALIREGRMPAARPTSTASSWLGGAPARECRLCIRGISRLPGCRAARAHP